MIYFIQCNGPRGPIKIGQSDDPQRRLEEMQTGNPYELTLLWVHRNNEDPYTEHEIHTMFEHECVRGEWFHPAQDIIDFISGEMENSHYVLMDNSQADPPAIRVTEHVDGDIYVDFFNVGGVVFNQHTKSLSRDY